jgi:hypothetical protein
MDAYATISDYEARFGAVDASMAPMVETRLADASAIVRQMAHDPSALDADAACMVVCNMVHRTVAVGGTDLSDGVPFTQMSQSAGVYSVSYSVANPYGDLYLTKLEKRMLGIGRVVCGSIDARVHDEGGE